MSLLGNPHRYALFAVLLLVTLAFYPGLNSPFILDDSANLAHLEEIQRSGFLSYIFATNAAGPTGRPVSLLTFALQHESWPGDARAFKWVNLLIHLANGVVLWFIALKLGRYLRYQDRQRFLLATLVTGVWLLHPMQTSTVFYVVQRMAQLSCFFTLLGVLFYLHARASLITGGLCQRLLIGMGFFICLGLAVGAKENGILLPLFILVIEYTLLAGHIRTRYWWYWAAGCLLLPLLVLIVFFIISWVDNLAHYEAYRLYTMGERLLTQAGVLWKYLQLWFLPKYGAYAVIRDDFPIATGLFSPFYTVFFVIGIFLILLFALCRRRYFPVLSFMILWFFAGHILESGHLSLELYFEHRNYLPLVGPAFGLGFFFQRAIVSIKNKKIPILLVIVYFLSLVGVTVLEAKKWGNPLLHIAVLYQKHPNSVRVLRELEGLYLFLDDDEYLQYVQDQLDVLQPDNARDFIFRMNVHLCGKKNHYSTATWLRLFEQAQDVKLYKGLTFFAELQSFLKLIYDDKCGKVEVDKIKRLLTIFLGRSEFSREDFLWVLTSIFFGNMGDYQVALDYIDEALKLDGRVMFSIKYLHKIKLLLLLEEGQLAYQVFDEWRQRVYRDPRLYLTYRSLFQQLDETGDLYFLLESP